MGRGQKSIISVKSARKELPLKGVKVTLMKEMARGDPGISAETAASSKEMMHGWSTSTPSSVTTIFYYND